LFKVIYCVSELPAANVNVLLQVGNIYNVLPELQLGFLIKLNINN